MLNVYITKLVVGDKKYSIVDLNLVAARYSFDLTKLPHSLKILLENIVRNSKDTTQLDKIIDSLKQFTVKGKAECQIEFMPTRILMQDFTGVPAIVDLAGMRDALAKQGGDPKKINPQIPVDLVIDHSIQVDSYGSNDALSDNTAKEITRNFERYKFLKWGQSAFENFKVVPPGTGICHQVNLEYLASIVAKKDNMLMPDTLVGTDSHTTMINSLSILGWGVGGIEAEAAMLGQPIPCLLPEVVGLKMVGHLNPAITATDLVLHITHLLREEGVVGKFVEYFGESLKYLSLADRATIANMSPEYGATCGFFPIDEQTIEYLKLTGRSKEQISIVEAYAKHQKLWRDDNRDATYSTVIELDLSSIKTVMSGPKRPQDTAYVEDIATNFSDYLKNHYNCIPDGCYKELNHGSVVIAAITSCTNTSNPSVMIAAGLVAKKAVEYGLQIKPWVKTSLAPGSQVVTEYLKQSGLDVYLNNLGFNVVAYGCTTCIGNSGPLDQEIETTITTQGLVVSAILSGNRNFEGRINPLTKTDYLASPPLVVIYSLIGNMMINPTQDVIGLSKTGRKIYLQDLWPSNDEIREIVNRCVLPELFTEKYEEVYNGSSAWQNIKTDNSDLYYWNKSSTYIKNPPFFSIIKDKRQAITSARILGIFGDSLTTDHISPAGNIAKDSPAGQYLQNMGVSVEDFNSYGSRRGNYEAMVRASFANIRIKNKICPDIEGGFTKYFPSGEILSIYDAAMQYKNLNIDLVVFGGKEYGTGSSRDWAAKGTKLLGVKAVIAESFERIHRSNLIGMGVLPFIIQDISLASLQLDGSELVDIAFKDKDLKKSMELDCYITHPSGCKQQSKLTLAAYTDNEIEYIKQGGVLTKVLADLFL